MAGEAAGVFRKLYVIIAWIFQIKRQFAVSPRKINHSETNPTYPWGKINGKTAAKLKFRYFPGIRGFPDFESVL